MSVPVTEKNDTDKDLEGYKMIKNQVNYVCINENQKNLKNARKR